jgi:hypothetical protein
MMIYQLLHDPETRTNNSYPFVVLVTKDICQYSLLSLEGFKELTTYYIAERKKNRLVKDGAEVIVVEKLSLEWAKVRK